MIMKLGMEHYELKIYLFYINNDHELTFTDLTAMTNLKKLVFSRAQISDERLQAIGPLASLFNAFTKEDHLLSHSSLLYIYMLCGISCFSGNSKPPRER